MPERLLMLRNQTERGQLGEDQVLFPISATGEVSVEEDDDGNLILVVENGNIDGRLDPLASPTGGIVSDAIDRGTAVTPPGHDLADLQGGKGASKAAPAKDRKAAESADREELPGAGETPESPTAGLPTTEGTHVPQTTTVVTSAEPEKVSTSKSKK